MKNKFNYSWFFGILLVFTLYIFLLAMEITSLKLELKKEIQKIKHGK